MAGPRYATNPKTGQRVMFDGKAWKPVGGTGVMSDTEADQNALTAARANAEKWLNTAVAAEEFVGHNSKADTGGLPARPIIPFTKALPGAPLWGDLSAAVTGNPAWSQMKRINSGEAPAQRTPGSGSSSDLDIRMFKEALPNIDTPGPSNQITAKSIQAKSDKANAIAAFKDRWFAQNGTLLGADVAFNKFWTARQAGDPVANNVQTKRLRFNPATGDFE